MKIAEGIVSSINTREIDGKFGPATAYSIRLNDEFYSIGFKKPAFNEGDKVQFVFTTKQVGDKEYHNSQGDIEVTGRAETPVTVSTESTPMKAVKGNKDDYWTAKALADAETSRRLDIVGSRNSAINLVLGAVEHGALVLPKAKGKTFDALCAAVEQTQKSFYLHPDNITSVEEKLDEEGRGVTISEGDFD